MFETVLENVICFVAVPAPRSDWFVHENRRTFPGSELEQRACTHGYDMAKVALSPLYFGKPMNRTQLQTSFIRV